ncbi:MAG: hypothetical protein NZZ41_01010 [Candidatus Dojkabacteria bacterium]|nr:hypothetical protein [Candidatus Dojkabacteria bacterium]
MNNLQRHFGILKNTNKKVAIVFHICPGTTDKALVCELESLPTRLADAVESLLTSKEAQTGPFKEFYHLLARRISPDSRKPLINELHERRYLYTVDHNNVYVMPRQGISILLTDLIKELRNMGVNFNQEELEKKLIDKQVNQENLQENKLQNEQKQQVLQDENKSITKQQKENLEEVKIDDEKTLIVDEEVNKTEENLYSMNLKRQQLEEKNKVAMSILNSANNAMNELVRYLEKAVSMNPQLKSYIIENYDNIGSRVVQKVEEKNKQSEILYKREKVVTSSSFPTPKRGRPIKKGK